MQTSSSWVLGVGRMRCILSKGALCCLIGDLSGVLQMSSERASLRAVCGRSALSIDM